MDKWTLRWTFCPGGKLKVDALRRTHNQMVRHEKMSAAYCAADEQMQESA